MTPPHMDGGIAHVAVPGPLLAEYCENALVSRLIHGIEPVKVRDAFDHHAVGVRQGFPDLPDPLPGHMRGAHDKVECLWGSSPALRDHKAMQRAQSCGADLGFAGAALRHDEGGVTAIQLPLDSLRYSQLGVVEGVARLLLDVVVDGQYLLRQRLSGRVEQGDELIPDALRHINAECVEIRRDASHIPESVRLVRDSAGDHDLPLFQALLQHVHYVPVIRQQLQQPGVQLFVERKHFHPAQYLPGGQLIQHVVLKLREQGRGGLSVYLREQAVPIPGRAKDVAFAGLGRFRLLGGVFFFVFSVILLIGGQSFVADDKGSCGICAVMGHMPLVGLGLAFQMKGIPVLNEINGPAAVNGIRHSAHHFRISAEADGGKGFLPAVGFGDDGVRVGGQTDLRLGVKIGQLQQVALRHFICSLLSVSGQKKTATASQKAITVFCVHYFLFQAVAVRRKGQTSPLPFAIPP